MGLTAAVTRTSATIAERILKSKQMTNARHALEQDTAATADLQEVMEDFAQNDFLVKRVTQDILDSGYDISSNTYKLVSAIMNPGATPSFFYKGIEVTTQMIGGDVSIEVSKLLAQASGRIISGSLSVVIGGATMVYDIYKLSQEVDQLAKSGNSASADLRNIADKLEEALKELQITEETDKEDDSA